MFIFSTRLSLPSITVARDCILGSHHSSLPYSWCLPPSLQASLMRVYHLSPCLFCLYHVQTTQSSSSSLLLSHTTELLGSDESPSWRVEICNNLSWVTDKESILEFSVSGIMTQSIPLSIVQAWLNISSNYWCHCFMAGQHEMIVENVTYDKRDKWWSRHPEIRAGERQRRPQAQQPEQDYQAWRHEYDCE